MPPMYLLSRDGVFISQNEKNLRQINCIFSECVKGFTMFNHVAIILTMKNLFYKLHESAFTKFTLDAFSEPIKSIQFAFDEALHECLFLFTNSGQVYKCEIDYYKNIKAEHTLVANLQELSIVETFQRDGLWYIISTKSQNVILDIYSIQFSHLYTLNIMVLENTLACVDVHILGTHLYIGTQDQIFVYDLILKTIQKIICVKDLRCMTIDKQLITFQDNLEVVIGETNEVIFELPEGFLPYKCFCENDSRFNLNLQFSPFVWSLPLHSVAPLWNHAMKDIKCHMHDNVEEFDIEMVYPKRSGNPINLSKINFTKIIDPIVYGYRSILVERQKSHTWSILHTIASSPNPRRVVEFFSKSSDHSDHSFGDSFMFYVHPVSNNTHFIPSHPNEASTFCVERDRDLWLARSSGLRAHLLQQIYFNN